MNAANEPGDWKDAAAAAGAEVDASLESPAESGVDVSGNAAVVSEAEAKAYAESDAAYAQYVAADEIDDEDEGDEEADDEGKPGYVKIPHDLKGLRKLIDQKNKSMVRLLNRRAGYALKIAEIKHAGNLPVRDDARERQVLEKVSKYNKGPLSDAALHRIFNCIMEEHRRLEEEAKEEAKDAPAGKASSGDAP